jgi:hypothetical protein
MSKNLNQTTTRRWRWLSGGLLLLLFSPILAAFIWYVVFRISNSRAVDRLEREVRQRGEPLTLAELDASYPRIPDELNAAQGLLEVWQQDEPEFWKAFLSGQRLPEQQPKKYPTALPVLGSSTSSIERGGPLSPEAMAAAQDYLAAETAHMASVRAALQRPLARFPIAITNGPACLLPHLSRIKHECQNFRLAALIAASQGNVDDAITALADCARTGQILADEPIMISQLVRVACLAIALSGTEDLIARQELTPAQLERVKSVLQGMEIKGGVERVLLGERAMDLSIFTLDSGTVNTLLNSGGDGTDTGLASHSFGFGITAMKVIGLAAADERLMLETFRDALVSAEHETPKALTELEQIFQQADTDSHRFPPKIFSALMLQNLASVEARFVKQEAHRRAGMVAVAVEQYRLQRGSKVPATLDQLVPQFLSEVPNDPFDGQPMRFKKLEKGYVVYSIGSDKSDDGGKERKPGRGGSQNIDEVFVVER